MAILGMVPALSAPEDLLEIPKPSIEFALHGDDFFRKLLPPDDSPAPVYARRQNGPAGELFPARHSESASGETREGGDRLLQLAIKVAPSVVALHVWDAYGAQLASGTGFIVSRSGIVMTDAELLHPSFADEIAYISVVTGARKAYRVTGVRFHDLATGVALLQIPESDAPFLRLRPDHNFAEQAEVTMIALHETEGLSLNDAVAEADESLAGHGWLNVTGEDSPGAIGSPVFDREGAVVAMIALHVPLDKWLNFALPIDRAAALLANGNDSGARPLDTLKSRDFKPVEEDPLFLAGWEHVSQKRYRSAAQAFLRLTRRYPRDAVAWALLALASHELDARDEAVGCSQKAVALNPEIGEYWRQLAAISLANKDGKQLDDDALKGVLAKASEESAGDAASLMLLGERHMNAGEFEEADAALRQSVALDDSNGYGYYLLAYVQGKLGDLKAAESAIKRAVKLRPGHVNAWICMGLVYTEMGEHRLAAQAFQRSVKLEPDHQTAWMNLARAWKNAGDRNRSRIAFMKHQEVTER